jgi:hypothetical protein
MQDLIHMSAMDFKDINHCLQVVSQILASKPVTDQELRRLRYVEKVYLQACININKTLDQ